MSRKINILYIIDELNLGGTEKQLLTTIELLDRKRFAPHLVCLRPSEYYAACDIRCEKQILGVDSLLSFRGVMGLIRLSVYLRKNRIDIVQTYFFDSSLLGVLAAKLAFVKKVISCRRDMGFWYSLGLVRVLKCINIFVDRFLVNSFAIKENIIRLESIPSHKIDVIYNGIELDTFSGDFDTGRIRSGLGIKPDHFVVGIVANLNRPVKRVDIFLKVAAEVLKRLERVSFLIVGGGRLEKELKSLATFLEIQDKVYFIGLQKDIILFLSIFDIGVITSESEGFSNSILEYMATGIPIVCTDSGGSGELVENEINGYLVNVSDHYEMADKILAILKSRELKDKMRIANKLKIKNFLWDRIIRVIEDYYRSLIPDQK